VSGTVSLIEGDVRAHLVRMTVPMIWAILAMMSLNVVDTWFVAQLGKAELAAMSFTFPVVMVLISLGIGLMAGTSSVLARVIGRGDWPRVQRLTTDALILAAACSVVLSVIGLATMDPLFRLLGADDELLPLIRQYMTVWYLGYGFFLVPMAGMGAIRAIGDARLQSRIMLTASLINLVLDPILIFGLLGFPQLGMAGAALATVLARAATLVMGFHVLHNLKGMMALSAPTKNQLMDSWKSVGHVGIPAAGTNVIIPLATGVVVAMVADHGASAVAGYGAASRLEALALVVFFAMSSVIGPFVGQNLGAGRTERIATALRESTVMCLVLGAVMALIMIGGATTLLGFFSDDPDVIANGRLYLLIHAPSFGAAGVIMVINAAFNGIGRPGPAVAISTFRMFIIMVPLAWVGGRVIGLGGVYAGLAIANVAAAALAWLWYRRAVSGLEEPAT
jgi:putative MATE family efflux protein